MWKLGKSFPISAPIMRLNGRNFTLLACAAVTQPLANIFVVPFCCCCCCSFSDLILSCKNNSFSCFCCCCCCYHQPGSKPGVLIQKSASASTGETPNPTFGKDSHLYYLLYLFGERHKLRKEQNGRVKKTTCCIVENEMYRWGIHV